MKLIVIVQKIDINDDNLSFFHRMLEKFSERLEKVYAACLWEGKHNLPDNVEVFSLGKERGYSKLRQFFRLQRFLFSHLQEVDGVYVHMGSIFAIASFPLAKIFRKKLVLWYAHGAKPLKLKIAEKLVDTIVTSSLAGCRLKSKKVKVLGQGIDIDFFKPTEKRKNRENFRILYAGRLVPIKGHPTLIEAVDTLVNQKGIKDIKLKIMGTPFVAKEEEYLKKLKDEVKKRGLEKYIEFLKGVPHSNMPKYYQEANLFVNPSSTGSLDKVVLEAMASGCLVLTCNEAYKEILDEKYFFKKGNAQNLAEKISSLMAVSPDPNLRDMVIKNHNLDSLIDKTMAQFYD